MTANVSDKRYEAAYEFLEELAKHANYKDAKEKLKDAIENMREANDIADLSAELAQVNMLVRQAEAQAQRHNKSNDTFNNMV